MIMVWIICRALEVLQEINCSLNRRSKFSEAALQRLLDSNLSVKYSLTGCLSHTDITADGFYDLGQVHKSHHCGDEFPLISAAVCHTLSRFSSLSPRPEQVTEFLPWRIWPGRWWTSSELSSQLMENPRISMSRPRVGLLQHISLFSGQLGRMCRSYKHYWINTGNGITLIQRIQKR